MSELIGLHGRAGAGKDTAYGFIREWGETRGYTVKREAFADRLKLSAARIFRPEIGLEEAVAWCNDLKEHGVVACSSIPPISGRTFLQRFGTEAHRDVFGPNFWVDAVLGDLSADFTVVTDVRFPNEAEAIRARGGQVWRVIRPGDAIAGQHASEQPLPERLVDFTLENDGTLDCLRESIWILMGARWPTT